MGPGRKAHVLLIKDSDQEPSLSHSSSAHRDQLVADFVRISRPFHERLYRLALTLCHDQDQAADLTQEALVRAFKAFDRYDQSLPIFPWLCRILRNLHLDSFKTGRARHEVAGHRLETSGADIYENVSAPISDPCVQAERSQLTAWLQEEIALLDEAHGTILILCDIEGLSYKEAAEVADIPVGTVRSRLSRCRQHLRQRMEQRMKNQRENGGGRDGS